MEIINQMNIKFKDIFEYKRIHFLFPNALFGNEIPLVQATMPLNIILQLI